MIYIALGANLPSRYGTPAETLKAAVQAIADRNIEIVERSSIWCTAPVPYDPNIPVYHNAVISIKTDLGAYELLQLMLDIEHDFGRIRTEKNAPRLLDLDLIIYHDDIIKEGETLIVPHPRMHKRLFVLKPLEEVSKNWVHPLLNQDIKSFLLQIDESQEAEKLKSVTL